MVASTAAAAAAPSVETFWADSDRHLVRCGGEFTREIIDRAAANSCSPNDAAIRMVELVTGRHEIKGPVT
ncbi:hypothetical protein ABT121_15390 [Streptomyces sp. NPDC001928]|uniref:hypothetical protein n=1 Tax=Streptomyces sp. NPDC001928 TaxID=3154404 RepID=UPI00332FA228